MLPHQGLKAQQLLHILILFPSLPFSLLAFICGSSPEFPEHATAARVMSNDFLLCFVPLEMLTFLGGGGGQLVFPLERRLI